MLRFTDFQSDMWSFGVFFEFVETRDLFQALFRNKARNKTSKQMKSTRTVYKSFDL